MQTSFIPARLFRITRPLSPLELHRELESVHGVIQARGGRVFFRDGIILAWRQDQYFVWVRESFSHQFRSEALVQMCRVAPLRISGETNS